MIYLLVGHNFLEKNQKIEEIKNKTLSLSGARNFDYEVLDGAKIDAKEFKQALLVLPVISKKRLLVIRSIHKLKADNQKILLEFIQSQPQYVDFICDSDEGDSKTAFFDKLSAQAKVFQFGVAVKSNVFDVTKAIGARNPQQALKMLTNLLEEGNHPLQLMGGLIWFWGGLKGRLSSDKFRQGLVEIQKADLNIKRSRLSPENALEVLIVKLSCLSA